MAALIHGGGTDSRTWHRVGPALADRGFRVIAVDLRGHGQSPRGYYSPRALADDLVENLPEQVDLAVGHCLGAAVLALALPLLRPRHAVYAEPYWSVMGSPRPLSPNAFAEFTETDPALLAARHPRWTPADIDAEIAARACWDVRVSLDLHRFDMPPAPDPAPEGSLVLLADADEPLIPIDPRALRERGFRVRTVSDAGHAIHHDNLPGFLTALQLSFSCLAYRPADRRASTVRSP
ncbi:alpha/beta hydrolase [Nocardia terrae]|uniref:alpha/beta hydrolase n=1 Tax=Nocardia terrae TaxID=2675851 RepID=UPI0018DF1EA9|nr:alpha/beta hydrolase [Nocardia terrae]